MSEPSSHGSSAPESPGPPERTDLIDHVIEWLGVLEDAAMHTPPPDWLELDLSMGQMRLLFLLESQGPVAMSRIAAKLGIGMPAASGFVERVERHGLVRRSHRDDDRRIVECDLTDAGRDLVARISGRRNEYTRGVLDLLTTDELGQLDRMLAAVHDRMTMRRTESAPTRTESAPTRTESAPMRRTESAPTRTESAPTRTERAPMRAEGAPGPDPS